VPLRKTQRPGCRASLSDNAAAVYAEPSRLAHVLAGALDEIYANAMYMITSLPRNQAPDSRLNVDYQIVTRAARRLLYALYIE
jgi:hypothetical protein